MNKGSVTIGRRNSSHNDDYMVIAIRDELSRLTLVEVKMSMADFALALTGMAQVNCELETKELSCVGKKKEVRPLEFEMPDGSSYSDKDAARKEALRVVEDGWQVDLYFSSQGSFFDRDDNRWARTSIFRYT